MSQINKQAQKLAVAKEMILRLASLMELNEAEQKIISQELQNDQTLCLNLADIAATWAARGGKPAKNSKHLSMDHQAIEHIRRATEAVKVQKTNRLSGYSDWTHRVPGSFESPAKRS